MPHLRITPEELIYTMEKLKGDCKKLAVDAVTTWGPEDFRNIPVVGETRPFDFATGIGYAHA